MSDAGVNFVFITITSSLENVHVQSHFACAHTIFFSNHFSQSSLLKLDEMPFSGYPYHTTISQ